MNEVKPIDTNNLLNDLNAKTNDVRYEVAVKTITLLQNNSDASLLYQDKKVAYVALDTSSVLNEFGKRLKEDWKADTYFLTYKDSTSAS